MQYEFFIALRYLRVRKAKVFVSRISVIALIIVSLAIFLPMLTMSIMNGFHDSVIEKHINKDYHVQVRRNNFYEYKDIMERISVSAMSDDIEYVVPFYISQGLLKRGEGRYFGVIFKGSDSKVYSDDKSFNKHFPLIAGDYVLGKFGILIGDGLARLLNPGEGSYSSFIEAVRAGSGPIVHFLVSSSLSYERLTLLDRLESYSGGNNFFYDKSRLSIFKLRVGGVFRSGYLEYDNYLVFSGLRTAQVIYDARVSVSGERHFVVTGLGIKLLDRGKARSLQLGLQAGLSGGYSVSTWESSNKHLLYAFGWEDRLMGVILFIMVFVSVIITIYINLNIIVMDKRREIGVLRSFGVSSRVIERVFTIEGFLIGFLGSIFGSIFSILFIVSLMDIISYIEFLVNFVLGFYGKYVSGEEFLLWEFFSGGLGHLKIILYRIEFWDLYILVFLSIFISVSASYFSAKAKAKDLISSSLRYE